MLTESRLVAGSLLTNSAATYYTASKLTTVTLFHLVNSHTDVCDFYIYVVPPSGAAGTTNLIYKGVLQAGDAFPYFTAQVLPVGYTIQAKASVGAVVAFSANGYIKS